MSEIKNKILNDFELTSEDFVSILWGGVEDVEVVESILIEERRSVIKRVILKIDERFFEIYYYPSTIERQEDEFFEQPATEVKKKEFTIYI